MIQAKKIQKQVWQASRQLRRLKDIKNIKIVDNNIQVICRINPVHSNTEFEINEAIFYGANFIMLPMFTTSNEVDYVYRLINGRAKLILLFETPQSIVRIRQIISEKKFDEAHRGAHMRRHLLADEPKLRQPP